MTFELVQRCQQHCLPLLLPPSPPPSPPRPHPTTLIYNVKCLNVEVKVKSHVLRGKSWELSEWGPVLRWRRALARSDSSPPACPPVCEAERNRGKEWGSEWGFLSRRMKLWSHCYLQHRLQSHAVSVFQHSQINLIKKKENIATLSQTHTSSHWSWLTKSYNHRTRQEELTPWIHQTFGI